MLMFVINANRSLLDPKVNQSIMLTAYQMLRFSATERKMQGNACEGRMTSSLTPTRYVGTSGILFEAIFDSEEGHFDIRFMLTESNIKELETTREYLCFMGEDGPDEGYLVGNPVYGHFARN
jgi:hypothetical protein